jgi:quercetin 2,3-dioxygenase
MSGPLTRQDAAAAGAPEPTSGATVEITEAHTAHVGGLTVQRALPRRGRRTVGAWCFADHAGPASIHDAAMLVGPHPHIGLQTVTWLLDGTLLHTDSLGSEQPIRPGQLNLMTAGRGVAHAEESIAGGPMHAVQLWIAQPESTRHRAPAFEHHADLPRIEQANARITVVTGELQGHVSPARTDTALVGAELALRTGPTTIPLRREFEHALIVLDGSVQIEGTAVPTSALAYLGSARDEITVHAQARSLALLIGGEPFEAAPLMWWNFVARTRDEVDAARRDWQAHAERFGEVRSRLARIEAPVPFWANPPAG